MHADSLLLVQPLSPEDCDAQSMPDASPAKWHLAHTTWFFETFVLLPHLPGYSAYDAGFTALFNSYYDALGPQYPRSKRGLLARPDLPRVLGYRLHVDEDLARLLDRPGLPAAVLDLIELGLHHEHQHQELLLTDIKHLLSQHPQLPAYRADLPLPLPAQQRVHMMLGSKAGWVQPELKPGDARFDECPTQSIEDWHRGRGLWSDRSWRLCGVRQRCLLRSLRRRLLQQTTVVVLPGMEVLPEITQPGRPAGAEQTTGTQQVDGQTRIRLPPGGRG